MAGAALTVVGGRNRAVAALAGLALNAGSALTRFGIFYGGIESAKDPKYTVIPQKQRLAARRAAQSSHPDGDAHEQQQPRSQAGA